jgi:hypothetical protein
MQRTSRTESQQTGRQNEGTSTRILIIAGLIVACIGTLHLFCIGRQVYIAYAVSIASISLGAMIALASYLGILRRENMLEEVPLVILVSCQE